MRRTVALRISAAAAVVLACGTPRLPAPEYTGQPTSALVPVLFPPPPAQVEVVPRRPSRSDAVWIDGEWSWRARRWAWKPGRWVVPPPGARFSPWSAVRDRLGTLYVAPGVWRDAHGAEIAEPPPLASASPALVTVVSPEGEETPHGPPLPLDAGGGAQDGGDTLDDAGAPRTEDSGP